MATSAASGRERHRVSRRTLVGYGIGTAGAILGGTATRRAVVATEAPQNAADAWPTWLLSSASELRPAAPPAPTAAEIDELQTRLADLSEAERASVDRWGRSPAVIPWTDLGLKAIADHGPTPVRAGRALALLDVAISDTVLAVRVAQVAVVRPGPPVATPQVGVDPTRSSFPSEHAAIAAAAALVLDDLFPNEPAGRFVALAAEAAESRLWAGTNYRSDVENGLALGRAIGARAVERGRVDGAEEVWTGTRPTGDGFWQPTPPAFLAEPLDPLAGHWQTWVLPSGSAARPAPPPAYGSPAWASELAAVRAAVAQ